MSNIILTQLSPYLAQQLQQRAFQNQRTLEAEITAILNQVISPDTEVTTDLDLTTAIEQRFTSVGDFEIPEISRETIRNPF